MTNTNDKLHSELSVFNHLMEAFFHKLSVLHKDDKLALVNTIFAGNL